MSTGKSILNSSFEKKSAKDRARAAMDKLIEESNKRVQLEQSFTQE
jgi:hypothetical protein